MVGNETGQSPPEGTDTCACCALATRRALGRALRNNPLSLWNVADSAVLLAKRMPGLLSKAWETVFCTKIVAA
jgi:hypothetical protein